MCTGAGSCKLRAAQVPAQRTLPDLMSLCCTPAVLCRKCSASATSSATRRPLQCSVGGKDERVGPRKAWQRKLSWIQMKPTLSAAAATSLASTEATCCPPPAAGPPHPASQRKRSRVPGVCSALRRLPPASAPSPTQAGGPAGPRRQCRRRHFNIAAQGPPARACGARIAWQPRKEPCRSHCKHVPTVPASCLPTPAHR
mgnify:CR=1 FL=1